MAFMNLQLSAAFYSKLSLSDGLYIIFANVCIKLEGKTNFVRIDHFTPY